ncbi:DNA methylase [Actinacidiphila sp. ITFR-21]|uniref:DNA methylase n=1 Tax=Actinacidiphila sp. ITFR-21 TaxID=3075199 RepID=UPI00288B20A8|nr:DNA methylase [Streptomyces sp. ITFR-21]WNI19619.1 DNA methylase [Streptomyces sp. ITFR-21]
MTQRTLLRRQTVRPLLLDLYSCAGGAGTGYHRAGFDVHGVDIVNRTNYPFHLTVADALEHLAHLISTGDIARYAFVHASPPCQDQCNLTVGTNRSRGWGGTHEDLVAPTRELLDATGLPYVIEQPNGRAQIRKDITLRGEMFRLGVIRHRNFELGGWSTDRPAHVPHRGRVSGWRHGRKHTGPYVAAYGSGGGKPTVPQLQAAMGITWTDVREELTEAIPPAYGEWLGRAYLTHAATAVAA